MRGYSLKEEVAKYGKKVCSIRAMKGGKIMIEDLKYKFDNLADEEKIEFMKLIMPSMREIFRKNPEKAASGSPGPCSPDQKTFEPCDPLRRQERKCCRRKS